MAEYSSAFGSTPMDPGTIAQRQASAQTMAAKADEERRKKAAAETTGFDEGDFFTKILLPIGLGVATGVTGGIAAPAAAGVAGAIGAGLSGAMGGMATGAGLGGVIEGAAAEDPARVAAGLGQTAAGAARLTAPGAPLGTPKLDMYERLAKLLADRKSATGGG